MPIILGIWVSQRNNSPELLSSLHIQFSGLMQVSWFYLANFDH